MECGIDEAGRGPVLGPLVVAAVAAPDPQALWDLGCRDSKQLTGSRRDRIARLLRGDATIRIAVRVLSAEEIDRRRANESLNDIELDLFRQVAAEVEPDSVVADAADVDADRFGRRIAEALDPDVDVVARHRADEDHGCVAAASIIAKTVRDDAIAELARRLEQTLDWAVGSGYPSDPATKRFLAEWVNRFGDLPPGTRRSWKTAQRLLDGAKAPQSGLDAFGG